MENMKIEEWQKWPFQVIIPRRQLLLGYLCSAFGMVLIPLPLVLSLIIDALGSSISHWLFLFFFCTLFVTMPYGLKIIHLGKRMRMPDAISILHKDKRPPVLFLRSFEDDDFCDWYSNTFPSGTLSRYEVIICKSLSRLGPPIAIGWPGEKLPETGAARLYVKEKDWRTAIEFFYQKVVAVIIIVGRSEGIWWEIETALQQVSSHLPTFDFSNRDSKLCLPKNL